MKYSTRVLISIGFRQYQIRPRCTQRRGITFCLNFNLVCGVRKQHVLWNCHPPFKLTSVCKIILKGLTNGFLPRLACLLLLLKIHLRRLLILRGSWLRESALSWRAADWVEALFGGDGTTSFHAVWCGGAPPGAPDGAPPHRIPSSVVSLVVTQIRKSIILELNSNYYRSHEAVWFGVIPNAFV